jgi:mono/diheme cytochrome c family protein
VRRLLPITLLVLLGVATWAQTRTPLPRIVRAVPRDAGREAAPERGRRVYERYGCALCHGANGEGGFANPNAETAVKVPGVLYVAEGYTVPELRRKILAGVQAVGKHDPKGATPPYRMPGWAGQMSNEELDDLVQYLTGLYPKSAEEKWR